MLIPKNRHEYYLAVISGNDYPIFSPKTREEQYLAKLAGREVDVPSPKTPKEREYYNIINDIKFTPENRWQTFVAAANDDSITAPVPITREEIWWSNISLSREVIVEYVGTLPATLQTVEGYLENYKIYGNPSGCGERTRNLLPLSDKTFTITAYNSNLTVTCSGGTLYFSGTVGEIPGNYSAWKTNFAFELEAGTYYCNNPSPLGGGFGRYIKKYSDNAQILSASNYTFTLSETTRCYLAFYIYNKILDNQVELMLNLGSTALPYEPFGYKLPLTSGSTSVDIYIGDAPLAKDEYVDSATGKIYRRTKNLAPPEEGWIDGQIWGDGTVHPSTEIKTSPFIDVSTCETCIMEVFSAETEWAAAGYREMAFYDENKQYLGWIGGGGRRVLTPNSSERLSEFPAGTVYVRISCSHGDQPFYPQLVSGYTPTHRFYPYLVPTDPPAPFPQIPTFAGTTVIDYNGTPKPDKVELTYKTIKKSYISADDEVYQDPNGQLLGG